MSAQNTMQHVNAVRYAFWKLGHILNRKCMFIGGLGTLILGDVPRWPSPAD